MLEFEGQYVSTPPAQARAAEAEAGLALEIAGLAKPTRSWRTAAGDKKIDRKASSYAAETERGVVEDIGKQVHRPRPFLAVSAVGFHTSVTT